MVSQTYPTFLVFYRRKLFYLNYFLLILLVLLNCNFSFVTTLLSTYEVFHQ